MEQSLTEGALFGAMGIIFTLFIYYDNRKSISKVSTKIGYALVLYYFIWLIVRNLSLLYSYDLVPGTTLGTVNPIKQTSTRIEYEYYYKGKLRHSSILNKQGVIEKGGKYYVRVVNFFPYFNEIDFSLPITTEKLK